MKPKLLKMTRQPFLIIIISLVMITPIVAYSQSNDGFKIIKIPDEINSIISNPVIYGISIFAVFLIILSIRTILKRDPTKPSFLDMVRDTDWYPSLSRFQFLIWTCIVLFAFFSVYLIRLSNGVMEPISAMPENLLILMGISIVSPVAGTALSSVKYNVDSPSSKPSGDQMKKRGFYTMLEENGKPSLTRTQMFSWTWIAVVVYLILFFSSVNSVTSDYMSHKSDCDNSYNIIKNNSTASIKVEKKYQCMYDLSVPNVDQTFVVLMGLSQGAYLGGKFIVQQKPQISSVSVNPVSTDNIEILIIGANFGQTAGVIKADDKVIDPPQSGTLWTDEKIKLTIPKSQLPQGDGKCKFTVISGGIASNEYDNSGKTT